jgi:hypothetical protein
MLAKNNMYSLSVKQWNPFVGCKHECIYCISSFQRQLKRQKQRCVQCYNFDIHTHANRLTTSLPRTSSNQYIFTCSNGDIAFCSTVYLDKILSRIRQYPNSTFLMQTKDPSNAFFRNGIQVQFPENVILGITLETNRDNLYGMDYAISKAPLPSQRYKDFLKVVHPRKMVTIEPIIDFDMDVMMNWINNINPNMIWIGYDSKNNYLPEPELSQVNELQQRLSQNRLVFLKTIRKAWWE